MSQPSTKPWIRSAALCGALAVSFFAGAALATDSKLDEAQASLTKAITLLKEAQGEGDKFEEHRKKAVDLVTRAQGELAKAKTQ